MAERRPNYLEIKADAGQRLRDGLAALLDRKAGQWISHPDVNGLIGSYDWNVRYAEGEVVDS